MMPKSPPADDQAASLVAAQIEATAREVSNLVGSEDAETVRRFVALAARTISHLPRPSAIFAPFHMDPASAFSGVAQMSRWSGMPDDALQEWSLWRDEYEALIARNPRLELAGMLGWISEVVDASSWPDGYEDELRDWVDRDERLPLPRMLGPWAEPQVDESFYRRLVSLRAATGGWIRYDHILGQPFFETDVEHTAYQSAMSGLLAINDEDQVSDAFRIGPDGQIRPADPATAARLVLLIATREIDERGAADATTRNVLDDPEARPRDRRAAWRLRREHVLDDLGEIVTLWDHLHAWGEGRISYREVMERCRLDTLEDLLAAALNSEEPLGRTPRVNGTIALVGRIRREHLDEADVVTCDVVLRRRGISDAP